jgi:hypothetical protein
MCCRTQRDAFKRWLATAYSYVGARDDNKLNPLSLGILFWNLSFVILSIDELNLADAVILFVTMCLAAFFFISSICLKLSMKLTSISWLRKIRIWFFVLYFFVFMINWLRNLPQHVDPLFHIMYWFGFTLVCILFFVFVSKIKVKPSLCLAVLWVIVGIIYLCVFSNVSVCIVCLMIALGTFVIAVRLWKLWNKLPI